MTYTTINSNGSPVLGWDEATEGETTLQRTRRRLQAGRCVACGAAERMKRQNLCAGCWEHVRFCTACEQVVPLARYRTSIYRCADCGNAYNRVLRARRNPHGEAGREAIYNAGQRGNARSSAQSQARTDEMGELRARGWTWDEIGRRYQMLGASAKSLYYRNRRRARVRGEVLP